jgi:hypothetical protein
MSTIRDIGGHLGSILGLQCLQKVFTPLDFFSKFCVITAGNTFGSDYSGVFLSKSQSFSHLDCTCFCFVLHIYQSVPFEAIWKLKVTSVTPVLQYYECDLTCGVLVPPLLLEAPMENVCWRRAEWWMRCDPHFHKRSQSPALWSSSCLLLVLTLLPTGKCGEISHS